MAHETQKVEIFGEKYVVLGEASSEQIQAVAREVDKRMYLIARRFPRLPHHQVAVLTALNLADDLAKLREEQETLMQLLGEKTE